MLASSPALQLPDCTSLILKSHIASLPELLKLWSTRKFWCNSKPVVFLPLSSFMMAQNTIIALVRVSFHRLPQVAQPWWGVSLTLCSSHTLSPAHNCWLLLLLRSLSSWPQCYALSSAV